MNTREYKDFDLKFARHPETKDIVKKSGEAAITQSLKNLVLTIFYERPYRASIGSKAAGLLFENLGPITEELIRETVKDVIEQHEPRAEALRVNVTSDFTANGWYINIYYKPINVETPVTAKLFLKRLR